MKGMVPMQGYYLLDEMSGEWLACGPNGLTVIHLDHDVPGDQIGDKIAGRRDDDRGGLAFNGTLTSEDGLNLDFQDADDGFATVCIAGPNATVTKQPL